ncbi:unnamed protein product, partial [Rotaria sp. Silwood1]
EYPREKSQRTKVKHRNKKGPRGNAALYECCLLGLDSAESLRILLKHGGDASWLNDKNESVIDI